MAFIGDDQVKAFDRDLGVVMDEALRLAPTGLETRFLLILLRIARHRSAVNRRAGSWR